MSQSFVPPGEVGTWSATEVAALRLRNSQHAAILQVPGEILVSIFRQVIKTNPDGYEEAVRLVTSICHHLRTLVFNTPELWGFVNMRGSLGPLFLHRCQGNPISVVPFFYDADPEGREKILICLDYWRRMPNLHLTRVELIEFCGTSEEFMALTWILVYQLPKLESLTLVCGTPVTEIISLGQGVETWFVTPHVQRTLKDVHLQQVRIPWSSNAFYGLSTLTLDYRGFLPSDASIPMDAFLEVLSHSPRLEKCCLYFALPQCHNGEIFKDFNPARTINFPLLEELALFDETLHVAYLLRHIQYPPTAKVLLKLATPPDELEGLLSILFPPNTPLVDTPPKVALRETSTIEYRPALEIGCTTIQYLEGWDGTLLDPNDITHTTFTLPLMEAIHRAGPTIRSLNIRINCELAVQPEVWKEILEHLPNLEELAYMPGDGADHDWAGFWEALCQTGGNGLVCQSLRTLRVVNLQGVTPDAVACVVMRWKSERPLDMFWFRVANCERSSTPEIIARLRPFVGRLIFEIIEGTNVVRLT